MHSDTKHAFTLAAYPPRRSAAIQEVPVRAGSGEKTLPMKENVLNRILDFFARSLDFNGILVPDLSTEFGVPWSEMREILGQLVQENRISLAFSSHSLNPHVKRLPDLPVDKQVAKLFEEEPYTICAYPTSDVIRAAVDLSVYDTQPFTQRLALAEPHLTPVFFGLEVLDRYYRDPRYYFEFSDFAGSIGITTEHYDSQDIAEQDQILLQSFGIGYDSRRNRVVVAFLRYLANLSPEHQQIWSAHVVHDECSMNSDYERATIYGYWPEHYSAYQAFLTEQAEINKLAHLVGKPSLFRETFEEQRPKGFIPMLRPTRRNFDEFILLLDKMLSENINRDFFKDDIPLERQVERDDGAVEVQRPGTLRLMEEWLSTKYRTADGEDVSGEVVAPLKQIRKLRQKPAHKLQEDEYDLAYPQRQDEILGKACRTLTKLRYILWSHPRARERYSPPAWLDGDKIVFY